MVVSLARPGRKSRVHVYHHQIARRTSRYRPGNLVWMLPLLEMVQRPLRRTLILPQQDLVVITLRVCIRTFRQILHLAQLQLQNGLMLPTHTFALNRVTMFLSQKETGTECRTCLQLGKRRFLTVTGSGKLPPHMTRLDFKKISLGGELRFLEGIAETVWNQGLEADLVNKNIMLVEALGLSWSTILETMKNLTMIRFLKKCTGLKPDVPRLNQGILARAWKKEWLLERMIRHCAQRRAHHPNGLHVGSDLQGLESPRVWRNRMLGKPTRQRQEHPTRKRIDFFFPLAMPRPQHLFVVPTYGHEAQACGLRDSTALRINIKNFSLLRSLYASFRGDDFLLSTLLLGNDKNQFSKSVSICRGQTAALHKA